MPVYRIVGTVSVPFIHEIEALSALKAEQRVENMRLDALDNADPGDGENRIHSVVELDGDGNEIETD